MMSHRNHLFGYLTFGIMLQSPKYQIHSWIRQKFCSELTNAMPVYNTTCVLISMHVGLQMHKQTRAHACVTNFCLIKITIAALCFEKKIACGGSTEERKE